MTVLYVTPRDWWGAQAPDKAIEPTKLPVKNVFFTYTKGRYGFSEQFCRDELRKLQEKHMSREAGDIIYNFAIGGSGKTYECRGWAVSPKLGKRYKQLSNQSIFIAYMGIFKGTMPTIKMMRAGDWLVKLGIRRGFIDTKFVQYHITATGYEGYTSQKFDLATEDSEKCFDVTL